MLDKIKGFFTKKANHQTNTPQIKSLDLMDEITFGTHYPIISKNYDGEKTQGELGIITKNVIDFNAIRLRAHDAELKIDSIKTILSRYSTWIIGTGLKLQSEPNEDILKIEKINFDKTLLTTNVEALFKVWSESVFCDYSKEKTLRKIVKDIQNAAYVGGDCLVITRVIDKNLTIQAVDGSHLNIQIWMN